MMTNIDLINNLRVIANYYDEVEGDTGRMYAYLKAANSIKALPYQLSRTVLRKSDIPFVGDSIREKIRLMLSGEFDMTKYLTPLSNNIPNSEDNKHKNYMAPNEALKRIKPLLKSIPNKVNYFLCGSIRRCELQVGDVDILFIGRTFPNIDFDKIKASILYKGESKVKIKINDIEVDFRLTNKKSLACSLLYFTGPKDFNIRLRQLALLKGKKLNEYCIENLVTGVRSYPKTEEAIFSHFGLRYIPPEKRV